MEDSENDVGGYRRFYHTKTFLAQRSTLFKGIEADRKLAAICNYKKWEKIAQRRPQWDALRRSVPLAYLSGIGASLEVLAFIQEVDMGEYEVALARPLTVKYASERLLLAFGRGLCLPEGTRETEAVRILLRRAARTKHECAISFPGLKTIFVYPDGKVTSFYYPPVFAIRGGFLVPGDRSHDIGTCGMG